MVRPVRWLWLRPGGFGIGTGASFQSSFVSTTSVNTFGTAGFGCGVPFGLGFGGCGLGLGGFGLGGCGLGLGGFGFSPFGFC